VTATVLDASALLAFLDAEPGDETAARQIDGALMASVNYSEVLRWVIQGGVSQDVAAPMLGELGFGVVPVDKHAAEVAAKLRLETKELGLSLAECCCLALGIIKGGCVLTADPALAEAKLPVKVKLVRHRPAKAGKR